MKNKESMSHSIIRFTKMQGIGNDYIYVDTDKYPIPNPAECAIRWSAPHTGIGSDGLVLIGRSSKADFSMRIFNADGSEAMMCGNASRCIGKYVYEKGLTSHTQITLDTLSGLKRLFLHVEEDKVNSVTVDMGEPSYLKINFDGDGERIMHEEPIVMEYEIYRGTAISMGNPHLIIFVDDIRQINLSQIGPKMEHLPFFPHRTNVEFAQILANGKIRMRVWERGSGITKACGTGACATAAAAFLTGRAGRKNEVIMDGGTLFLEWNSDDGHLFMTGPAETVFEGEIERV